MKTLLNIIKFLTFMLTIAFFYTIGFIKLQYLRIKLLILKTFN